MTIPHVDRSALRRTIAVLNGKGGVGKTSLTANLSGLFADAGYRVLAIDLDPQGNLGNDLGYLGAGLGDGGAGLVVAGSTGVAPIILRDVRPRLDVVVGGESLHDLAAVLQSRRMSARGGGVTSVTGWEVAAAASGGRLLSPGWPPVVLGSVCNTSSL